MLRCEFGRRPSTTTQKRTHASRGKHQPDTIDSSQCACAATNLRHVVVKLLPTVGDHSTTIPTTGAVMRRVEKLTTETAMPVYRGYFTTAN